LPIDPLNMGYHGVSIFSNLNRDNRVEYLKQVMNYITLNKQRIAYLDRGEGPSIILVHCSSASHKEWKSLIRILETGYRVLAPDLLGYGESESWSENAAAATVSDVDVVEAMIELADSPVVLVAHSYGAAVCMQTAYNQALRKRNTIRGLILIEPVSFHLLRTESCISEWQAISKVGRQCISAVAEGKNRQAANAYMGFWLGWLKWRLAPKRFRVEVMRSVNKVAKEFQTIFELKQSADDYAIITCPISLLAGRRSPRPALKVIELLDDAIPHARCVRIDSAGHMSPFTHQNEVNELILTEMLNWAVNSA